MAGKRKKKKQGPHPKLNIGSLVLAQPFWADLVYTRAVILITNHDKEGSTGIIINKASTVLVKEALPDIDSEMQVYFGGPLNSKMVSYLHSIPSIPEADYLGNNIYIGGDPELLLAMIERGEIDFNKIRFCAGIVEWTAGLLEKEIKENKWWVAKITAKELFEDCAAETMWSYKLTQAGNMYGLFAHIPDPEMKETVAQKFDVQ